MLTRLDRITERKRKYAAEVFNNLYHLLDVELLYYSFRKMQRDKAPGVDGVTVEDYEQDLMANLRHLALRLKRRSYRPQPSLRREIPKGNGKTRPLGIAALEDKIVQRGVVTILERIYEEDFADFSYGFRPGRSCHDALKALSRVIGTKKVQWVLDADIRGFFDEVDHDWLVRMIEHRVKDPQMLWLIRRFLKAGVMVEGKRHNTERGVPQGSCLSPLLANVYLHYALDIWFAHVVEPRMRGEAYMVRYADDFICCFQYEADALRFQEVLVKRLAKFALSISPEKTKLLRFGRFARRDCTRYGEGRPGEFDFLGLTHYCGKSRKGRFKLKWKTSKKRYRAKLSAIKDWLRANRTRPLAELWSTLNRKLQGHYQYYGVSDNWPALTRFRKAVLWLAYRWLNRRSNRRSFTVAGFYDFVDRFGLASPKRLINLNSAFV